MAFKLGPLDVQSLGSASIGKRDDVAFPTKRSVSLLVELRAWEDVRDPRGDGGPAAERTSVSENRLGRLRREVDEEKLHAGGIPHQCIGRSFGLHDRRSPCALWRPGKRLTKAPNHAELGLVARITGCVT